MRVDDFIIEETATMLEAMKRLDVTGQRILFIAPAGKLKAVVTDGDLRKAILRGSDLQQPVSTAANYNPITLTLGERGRARSKMVQLDIDAVPLLDKDGLLADVMFANDFDVDTRKKVCLPVVVMAGGMGTRLYPYTKILPKPLIPVGELPIVEHIIHRFRDFGCNKFTLIVNYKKGMIKSYFAEVEKDYEVDFVDEDTPLGTGGGLSLMKGRINQPFFFTNCDILIDADYGDIYNTHKEKGNVITMVCALKNITIPYGVIDLNEAGEIHKLTEKPEMSFLTNTGLYVVEPRVVEEMAENTSMGFTDVIEKYRNAGEKVGVYPVRDTSWMDMGQLEELELMRRRMEDNPSGWHE